MARSILRAGKTAGVIIVAIIVVAAVLYSAGVLTFAQSDQPAPIVTSGEPAGTADEFDPDVVEETVQKHMRAGQYDDVEGFCNDVIAGAPGSDGALRARQGLAEVYIRTQNVESAAAAVDEMIGIFADHKRIAEAVCEVGDAWLKSGDAMMAIGFYEYVVENYPEANHSIWSQKNLCTYYAAQKNEAAGDAAIAALKTVFDTNHNISQALCEAGDAWLKSGDTTRAIGLYEYVVENYPEATHSIWSQKNLCTFYAAQQNEAAGDAAVATLKTVFEKNHNIAQALCEVGDAWGKAGLPDKAADIYRYVVEYYPASDHALYSQKNIVTQLIDTGDIEGANAAWMELCERFSAHSRFPRVCVQVGDAWRKAAENERAVDMYTDVANMFPGTNAAVWGVQNLIRLEIESDEASDEASEQVPPHIMEQVDQFIADFASASDMTMALCLLGEVYHKAGLANERLGQRERGNIRFAKALPLFAKVIDEAPFHSTFTPDAYYMSAAAYSRLGDYTKAIEYHQKIVDDWPDHHLAWSSQYWIGSFQQELKKQGLLTTAEADAKSEEAFLRLFEEYPDTPMVKLARSQLAMIYFRANRWGEAVSVYEQIILEAPPDGKIPKSAFYLAQAYERMGQEEMAVQTYREFLQAWPDSSWADIAKTAVERLGGQD